MPKFIINKIVEDKLTKKYFYNCHPEYKFLGKMSIESFNLFGFLWENDPVFVHLRYQRSQIQTIKTIIYYQKIGLKNK